MEKIHRDLLKKYNWYHVYHENSSHKAINWFLFLFATITLTTTLFTAIDTQAVSENNSNLATSFQATKLKDLNNILLSIHGPKQIEDTLKQRRDIVLSLIKSDPQAVIDLALPQNVVKALPASAQALVEQPAEVQGTVTIFHFDPKEDKSKPSPKDTDIFIYYLKTDNGKTITLHFAKKIPEYLTETLLQPTESCLTMTWQCQVEQTPA